MDTSVNTDSKLRIMLFKYRITETYNSSTGQMEPVLDNPSYVMDINAYNGFYCNKNLNNFGVCRIRSPLATAENAPFITDVQNSMLYVAVVYITKEDASILFDAYLLQSMTAEVSLRYNYIEFLGTSVFKLLENRYVAGSFTNKPVQDIIYDSIQLTQQRPAGQLAIVKGYYDDLPARTKNIPATKPKSIADLINELKDNEVSFDFEFVPNVEAPLPADPTELQMSFRLDIRKRIGIIRDLRIDEKIVTSFRMETEESLYNYVTATSETAGIADVGNLDSALRTLRREKIINRDDIVYYATLQQKAEEKVNRYSQLRITFESEFLPANVILNPFTVNVGDYVLISKSLTPLLTNDVWARITSAEVNAEKETGIVYRYSLKTETSILVA